MSHISETLLVAPAARTDVYRKISWRIMPFIVLCYLCGYLDRVNVGFAKLQMLNDLHMSDAVYGLGAGIFFIGYFIFEVPSNLILHRVGARLWIARIMITWAIISALTLLVKTPMQFYTARFFLGVAEAGFLAGHHVVPDLLVSREKTGLRARRVLHCDPVVRAWSAVRCQAGCSAASVIPPSWRDGSGCS